MQHEVRRKLLADYAVALVAERESWQRLYQPELNDAERCRSFGQWKERAARLKTLAAQVRDGAPDCMDHAHDAAPGPSGPEEPPALTGIAGDRRNPLPASWIMASSRLVTLLRARVEAAMPRPRST